MPSGSSAGAIRGHRVRPFRMRLREEEAAIENRQPRGDDHIACRHRSAVGFDAKRRAVAHVDYARQFENVAPVTVDPLRERKEILARVKLSLVVERGRAFHRVRERSLLDEARCQTGASRGRDLLLDPRPLGARLAVDVVRLPLEIAVDRFLRDEARDQVERALLRRRVNTRSGGVELLLDVRVDGAVGRRDFRRRVSRRAVEDPLRFDNRDRLSGLLQEQRRRDPDDPGSDDRHVDFDLVAQCGVRRLLRRLDPQRAGRTHTGATVPCPERLKPPPSRSCVGCAGGAGARMIRRVGSLQPFARFRRIVLADPVLERRLQSIADWPSFVEEAVGAAAEHGLALTEADVLAAREEATRSWLERWV